jgi:hypothetical protein
MIADVRQLDVDHVRELLDGKLADANGTFIALQVRPFMGLRIAKRFRVHHGSLQE